VAALEREPKLPQELLELHGVVGLDLGKVEAGGFAHLGQRGEFHGITTAGRGAATGGTFRAACQPVGTLFLQPDERAHGIHGRALHIGLAEDVVEDFQGDRSGVAGADHVAHELGKLKLPLAGKHPVVAAPGQHIHGKLGGVRHLDEKDLFRVDLLDRSRVPVAGQDVEGVQAGAEVGVVHHLHQAVRVLVVVDVLAPRQCLIGDFYAVVPCQLRKFAELRGPEVVVVNGGCSNVRAHQDGVHSQAGHELELCLRAPQVGLEQVRRDAVEIPEWLVEVQAEAEVGGHRADILGVQRRGDQVLFENLDAVEAGDGAGLHLFLQGAGEADGGDSGAHQAATSSAATSSRK
jgi:hypothetical protein